MRYIIIILITILFTPMDLMHSVTSGFSSPFHSDAGAVSPRISIQWDRGLTPHFSTIFGLGAGKTGLLNQINYPGDMFFADIRLALRYYFSRRPLEGLFGSIFLDLAAADVPYSLSGVQENNLNLCVGYGLHLGWKYTPLKINFNKRLGGIGIEPGLRIMHSHFFDLAGISHSAWQYTLGLELVVDLTKPHNSPKLPTVTPKNNNIHTTNEIIKSGTNTKPESSPPSTNSLK